MFATGRVDNIRANTQEALEWVTSMHNQHFTKVGLIFAMQKGQLYIQEQRVALFRKAADKQAKVTIEVIFGGIFLLTFVSKLEHNWVWNRQPPVCVECVGT